MVDEKDSIDEVGGAYSEEGREDAVDSDAMTAEEAGVVEGYTDGEKRAVCTECHRELYEESVERIVNGELHEFCSTQHAESYAERKEKELMERSKE